jgi:hypothetical protein
MRVVRGLAIAVGLFVLLIAAVVVGARFADGPLAVIAGGPLESGELVTGPEPDWSFVSGVEEIELQLLSPPRSRTTWIVEYDGRLFVPCGYLDTTLGRIWKRWHLQALADGRALVRIDGKRYERQLERVTDPPAFDAVATRIGAKYGVDRSAADVNDDALWIFELKPRG